MSSGGKLKRVQSTPGDKMKQQQLSSMFGDRVKKPRTFNDGVPPMLKKRKLESDVNGGDSQVVQQPAPVMSASVASQKRKWHLSELLRQNREAKKMRKQFTPAFVYEAPHMDSRRPQRAAPKDSNAAGKKKTEKEAGKEADDKGASQELTSTPTGGKCVFNTTAELPGTRSHGTAAVPGAEALLYSRSMLPKSHLLLLDVLVALESAVTLLRTRRVAPTFGAVQDIVRRSTRREFTSRILSQLAHLIPEAIAVLPPAKSSSGGRGGLSGVILRLDDVNLKSSALLGDESSKSILGDAAVRSRRSLLHQRLLDHVRECHSSFLKRQSIKRHESEVWHDDFDVEKEVPQLPSPTIDFSPPKSVSKRPKSKTDLPSEQDNREENDISPEVLEQVRARVKDQAAQAAEKAADSKLQDGIPLSLLQKVRERVRARETQAVAAKTEKETNRSLLSKLPCTMDTICSVLRSERRSAMGWGQLIGKVEKMHPKKWIKDDLERQFDAIAELGNDWCKKVELKSSRGGFAFRVVSEAGFGKARAKVSATKTYNENKSSES